MKKLTKVQVLGAIRSLLNNEEPSVTISLGECVDFIDKEIDNLTKKNSTPSKAVLLRQANNNKDREILLKALRDGVSGTCSEIANKIPEFEDYSAAKVSALLKPLVTDGQVIRQVVKGKAIFSLA